MKRSTLPPVQVGGALAPTGAPPGPPPGGAVLGAGGGSGGGVRNGSLAFSMEQQQQTLWCWSAVATSVANFFAPIRGMTQCSVASTALNNPACCGNPLGCNQVYYLDRALGVTNNLNTWANGAASFAQLESEVNSGRPVGCRIQWGGGTMGHFVAVVGYRDDGTDQTVDVEDPAVQPAPPTSIDYGDLVNNYQSSGSWTHTYYTQP